MNDGFARVPFVDDDSGIAADSRSPLAIETGSRAMTFLSVSGVGKRYGASAVLDDISFTAPKGGRTAIVGPSGSGKTTLLRIIGGFEPSNAGRITLDDEVLADASMFTPPHLRGVGFVTQDGALFPHLTVAENIGFGLDRGTPGRAARISELMNAVELDATMARRRPHELSGGQQQRVALARALARKPKLMLLDEPFSALDAGLRENMRRFVADALRAAGVTALLVTHDQAEALSFAEQVVVLRDGRMAQAGTPQELYQKPIDPETARFLGDAIILSADVREGWAVCAFGRVPASAGARTGARQMMLRPEQISIMVASSPVENGDSVLEAQVTDIEYGGGQSTVGLMLANGVNGRSSENGSVAVRIRNSSLDLPGIGARVRIRIRGAAHIFD